MLLDVSIIVPIYNTAKYLPQCLDSILKQKGLNLEIICVEGASTDNSKLILNSYALKYPENIKVISNPKDMGFGYSMNIGIEAATAPIICFVDSDDYLVENSLYGICNQMHKTNVDFIQMKQCLFVDVDSNTRVYDFTEFGHYNLRQDNKFAIVPYPWSKIYKSSFVKKFKFTESPGASYQDISFGGMVCSKAESIGLSLDLIYAYRYNRIGNSSVYASMITKIVFVNYEVYKFLYEIHTPNIDMVKVLQYILDIIAHYVIALIECYLPIDDRLIQLMHNIYHKYNNVIVSNPVLQDQILSFYNFVSDYS